MRCINAKINEIYRKFVMEDETNSLNSLVMMVLVTYIVWSDEDLSELRVSLHESDLIFKLHIISTLDGVSLRL